MERGILHLSYFHPWRQTSDYIRVTDFVTYRVFREVFQNDLITYFQQEKESDFRSRFE